MPTLRLISAADEAEWNRWLEGAPHDFYHTAAYHRFSERWDQAAAWLAVYGAPGRYLAWPYLLRPVRCGLCDVTSVYGYPGPVACGAVGDSFLARAWDELTGLWRSQKVVSVFTRFHPLLDNQRLAPDALPVGQTVAIDLTRPERDQWQDYHPGLRNRVRYIRKMGFETSADPGWNHLEEFHRFYCAMIDRHHAPARYHFPLEYFDQLRLALGPRAWLMATRRRAQTAAVGIFVEHAGMVHNHFSMNNPELRHLAPTKVLLDDVRRWAVARGHRVLHLGGGRGAARDSLFDFKAGFSRWRPPFFTGRRILDAAVYHRLCDGLPPTDFFPLYRAPSSAPGAAAA